MASNYLENSTEEMKNAINAFMSSDFDNITLFEAKGLAKKFRNFPVTLFKVINHTINSDKLSNNEKIWLLEYIDSKNGVKKNKSGLKIDLDANLFLQKLLLYDDENKFDDILYSMEKYGHIILKNKQNEKIIYNISDNDRKEELIVLFFRALTKSHKYGVIVELFEKHIKKNEDNYAFNWKDGNRFYNYLARAYSHQQNKQKKVDYYLEEAESFGKTKEENIIRNFRYKSLIYWRLKPSSSYHTMCKDAAEAGIQYLESENRKEKYKKYYSDINRMLAALYLDSSILPASNILSNAKKLNQKARDILKNGNYYYEEFWLDFQKCNFLRLEKEYDKAHALLKEIKNKDIYQPTIKKHPESEFKLLEEKCKLYLSEGIDKIDDLLNLLNNNFHKYSENNIYYEFKRLIFKTQAYIEKKERESEDFYNIAEEYYHSVKVMNIERKLNDDSKRHKEIKNFFETNNGK